MLFFLAFSLTAPEFRVMRTRTYNYPILEEEFRIPNRKWRSDQDKIKHRIEEEYDQIVSGDREKELVKRKEQN
jgi:hypothetical protein